MDVSFDLVEYIGRFVPLHKNGPRYFVGPCPMCGGRDRFTIKRNNDDVWMCRHCTADGKYHDAIDFVMQYHGVDFKEALKRMGEKLPEGKHHKPLAPVPVRVVPPLDWQADTWVQIDAANDRLIGDETGPAWQYLAGRGISKGAIYMNLLGFDIVHGRPAIVIPWLDVGNVITAVKYRFIDDQAKTDKGKRFAMRKGSMPYLFGLQHVLDSDKSLLFVEGELNAISVLQTLPRGVSIVSAGSDTNGKAPILCALARHYLRVIVWTDDPSKGAELKKRMNRQDARLIKSPILEGKKWDANEMLQNGLLADFLDRKLSTECLGIPIQVPVERTA